MTTSTPSPARTTATTTAAKATTDTPVAAPSTATTGGVTITARPPWWRRAAVAVTAAFASLPGTVWGVGVTVELATGVERDHLFHQITGQGLLLSVLWLGGLWPVAAAGWRGRAPSTAAALRLAAFLVAAVVTAVLTPGAGGAMVSGFAVVTSALLWLALPARTPLRRLRPALDPLALPVVGLLASLLVPFAVAEAALQRAMLDEHAAYAHNYDMALVSLTLVLLGLAAATVPAARRLMLWASLGAVVIGTSRALITDHLWWSVGVAAVGVLGTVLVLVRRDRRQGR